MSKNKQILGLLEVETEGDVTVTRGAEFGEYDVRAGNEGGSITAGRYGTEERETYMLAPGDRFTVNVNGRKVSEVPREAAGEGANREYAQKFNLAGVLFETDNDIDVRGNMQGTFNVRASRAGGFLRVKKVDDTFWQIFHLAPGEGIVIDREAKKAEATREVAPPHEARRPRKQRGATNRSVARINGVEVVAESNGSVMLIAQAEGITLSASEAGTAIVKVEGREVAISFKKGETLKLDAKTGEVRERREGGNPFEGGMTFRQRR